MSYPPPRRSTILVVLLAVVACGRQSPDAADAPAGPVPADTVGDTLVLHPQETGLWPTARTLRPDVVIGAEGDPKVAFGAVSDIAVEPNGEILVASDDRAVLRFSRKGKLEAFVGRKGEGPGEYAIPQSVTVGRSGAILVGDVGQRRIVEFDADGRFVRDWPRIPARVGIGGDAPLLDTAGALVMPVPYRRPSDSLRFSPGFVRFDSVGRVLDSIPPPSMRGEADAPNPKSGPPASFRPTKVVSWHPFGFPVVGVSDDYVFDLRRPDYTIRVRRPWEPVPVSSGERRTEEVVIEAMRRRGWGERYLPPPPPDGKPPFKRLFPSWTGDVWVVLYAPGVVQDTVHFSGLDVVRWTEPFVADVFTAEGRYRGRVTGPVGVDLKVIHGDTVWAVAPGRVGEDTVVRYLVR